MTKKQRRMASKSRLRPMYTTESTVHHERPDGSKCVYSKLVKASKAKSTLTSEQEVARILMAAYFNQFFPCIKPIDGVQL